MLLKTVKLSLTPCC